MGDWSDIRRGRIGIDLLAAEREARERATAKLLELVERGGGGVTLDRAGHAVYPTTGYAVGLVVGTALLDCEDDELVDSVRVVTRAFPDAPFVGVWRTARGLSIDPVAIVPTLAEALAIGAANSQAAVYSFATLEDIAVPEAVAFELEPFETI